MYIEATTEKAKHFFFPFLLLVGLTPASPNKAQLYVHWFLC